MSPDRGRWHDRWWDIGLLCITFGGAYYLFSTLMKQMNFDPEHEQKEQTRVQSTAILRQLDAPGSHDEEISEKDGDRPRKEDLKLSQYEQAVLQDLVFPKDIPVTFNDIGGLSDIIEELRESVIYPLTMPNLYSTSSSLLSAPSGVLLYGPPGCGKTMLAKGLARESGACFINLHISTLTEKWFGDSNKLVNAVFSLARKLEPTIVFIDEIDAVLGTRHSSEHEASGMVKAEFMTHWDGLASSNSRGQSQRVLILGATNRIHAIDDAILRRMPKKFAVSLPDASQRLKILKIILKDTKIDQSNFDMNYLAQVTADMSGSEIKEACRDAAMIPVREMIRTQRQNGHRMDQLKPTAVRGLRLDDFFLQPGGKKKPKNKRIIAEEKEWNTASSSSTGDLPESDMEDAQETLKK